MTSLPGNRPSPRTWSSNSNAIWPLVRSSQDASGTPALIEPLRGGRPGPGQIKPQGCGEVPLGADVVDGNGDLAVGLLAQLPAVLMFHADGVLALLGKAGVVEDEDPWGLARDGAITRR